MLNVVLLLLTVFFSGSHQQCFSIDDNDLPIETEQFNSWIRSGHQFSVSLFKYLDGESFKRNVLFSPWTIQEVLLLAYFGAEEETEASLAKVLQIPEYQEKSVIWHFYSNERTLNFRNDITSNPLKVANKIYLSSQVHLRRCMEEKLRNELELIDYQTDVLWAQNYINEWVMRRTDGEITDLIQNLSPASTATLVNGVFYNAKWLSHFNPRLTQYILFNVNSNEWRSTSMMEKLDIFEHGYSAVLSARLVLLPYEGNTTAMIIILPNDDLDSMIDSLNAVTLAFITDRRNYQYAYFKLMVPKYKHKSRMNFNTILGNLGIGQALTEYADYSGFTGRREVFISEVVQEVAIQVSEEGTATTPTRRVVGDSYMRKSIDFLCDRPFAYIIYDFFSSKVLFMGTFREP